MAVLTAVNLANSLPNSRHSICIRSRHNEVHKAHVAENTAQDHLERLVDLNVLLKSDQEGTTLYSPDPLYIRMQALRNLLEQYDRDALIQLKAELQSKIEGWRDEYGVDSPAALRERAASTETAAQIREIRKTASDWEFVGYRLSIVEDAIGNYTTYNLDSRDLPRDE